MSRGSATPPQPGGQVACASLGAREVVIGLAACARPDARGPAPSAAMSLAIAACDIVDGVATGAVRSELPSEGVPVMALAFGAAAVGIALAAGVRSV